LVNWTSNGDGYLRHRDGRWLKDKGNGAWKGDDGIWYRSPNEYDACCREAAVNPYSDIPGWVQGTVSKRVLLRAWLSDIMCLGAFDVVRP
jgi:hypothetical protein